MARINVYRYDSEDGKQLDGWFNAHTAEFFKEATTWDGNNHISVHTGSQWHHQGLYRTKGGRWVLNCWSNWQGSQETYQFITEQDARTWLLKNDDDAAAERFFGPIEEERGPGRPEIGPPVNVRFPEDVLTRLDVAARAEGISRAEKIRRLVEAAL